MNRIIHGDCLDELKKLPDNSIDSCVTDPPYGLSREPDIREVLTKWMNGEDYTHRGGGFMGKTWDSFVPGPSIWREVYRVLKPGGHLLCFAGTRTLDLMAISLRLAGFEIRDVIEWLYFSGFPKSMDVGKAFDKRAGAERKLIGLKYNKGRAKANVYAGQWNIESEFDKVTAPATELAKKWNGWGTSLKPSHEPIILARKPLDGTVADNVERWGTGALNIDGCRIWDAGKPAQEYTVRRFNPGATVNKSGEWKQEQKFTGKMKAGRFPANCVTTEPDMFYSKYFNVTPPELCKKASKRDRNSTCDGRQIDLPNKKVANPNYGKGGFKRPTDDESRKIAPTSNFHPTVKPTDLMAWLVRLVTPPGGIVLDPFCGSGSTLVAAKREGFSYVGIELEAEYVEIARARMV